MARGLAFAVRLVFCRHAHQTLTRGQFTTTKKIGTTNNSKGSPQHFSILPLYAIITYMNYQDERPLIEYYKNEHRWHEWVTQHEERSPPGKIVRWVQCSKCGAAAVYEILNVSVSAYDFKTERKAIGFELPEGATEQYCPDAKTEAT